jgi:hypothetical protein
MPTSSTIRGAHARCRCIDVGGAIAFLRTLQRSGERVRALPDATADELAAIALVRSCFGGRSTTSLRCVVPRRPGAKPVFALCSRDGSAKCSYCKRERLGLGAGTFLNDDRWPSGDDGFDATHRINAAPWTIDVVEPDGDPFDHTGGMTNATRKLPADSLLESGAQLVGSPDDGGRAVQPAAPSRLLPCLR